MKSVPRLTIHRRRWARGAARTAVRIAVVSALTGLVAGGLAAAPAHADTLGGPRYADLSLIMTGVPNPVSAGNEANFTSTLVNGGPATATGVVFTDTLPTNATFAGMSTTQGTCSVADGVVTCDLGSIAVAGRAVVEVQVTSPTNVGSGEVMANPANVSADQPDPHPGDNSACVYVTVVPPSGDGGSGWVGEDGGTVKTAPIGDGVTQSTTVTVARGTAGGAVVIDNDAPTQCGSIEGFQPYGNPISVTSPLPPQGHPTRLILAYVSGPGGVPPGEPLYDIEVLRETDQGCVILPNCRGDDGHGAVPPPCTLKVCRKGQTGNVHIVVLDDGSDPTYRGGG